MRPLGAPLLVVFFLVSGLAMGQGNHPSAGYNIYAGSTHAHTAYTWSHGDQFLKKGCSGILVYAPNPSAPGTYFWSNGYVKAANGCAGIYVIDSFQYPSPNLILKPDWQKYQGLPREHFELAKANGYDFYVTTDHSQEAA
ncbi:MAG: hypothetical protein ABI165_01030, partial [Bryobacteraceae bacterium]